MCCSNVVAVHRTDATYKDLPASQGSQSALDKCNRKLKEEYAGYKGCKAVKVHWISATFRPSERVVLGLVAMQLKCIE